MTTPNYHFSSNEIATGMLILSILLRAIFAFLRIYCSNFLMALMISILSFFSSWISNLLILCAIFLYLFG